MYKICSKLATKTQNNVIDVAVMSLFLTLNRFHTVFWCFHSKLRTSKYWDGSAIYLLFVKVAIISSRKQMDSTYIDQVCLCPFCMRNAELVKTYRISN